MEKSSIQNMANSTFTSQFFNPASKANIEKSLTAIKNSNNCMIKIESPFCTRSHLSKPSKIPILMINHCFFMQLSMIVQSQRYIFCREGLDSMKWTIKENLSSICVLTQAILKYSKLSEIS